MYLHSTAQHQSSKHQTKQVFTRRTCNCVIVFKHVFFCCTVKFTRTSCCDHQYTEIISTALATITLSLSITSSSNYIFEYVHTHWKDKDNIRLYTFYHCLYFWRQCNRKRSHSRKYIKIFTLVLSGKKLNINSKYTVTVFLVIIK